MAEEQRNRQLWLEAALIFAAWTVFGLITANQYYMQFELRGHPIPWRDALKHGLFEAYLWAFATLAIFWLARRFPLERGRMLPSIAVHLVGAVVLSLARVVFLVELSRQVEWLAERSFSRQFWGWFHQYLLYYALLLGIAHAVLYYGRYRERERAAERLAAGLTEARLQALKMQLQPHFLFNTLNTIAMKARTDPEETRKLLVRLSDFLRYAMKHTGHFAPFSEEYFFVRTYLYLEKARFGDRLKIRYDVDPQCMSLPVPVLTIQPLIENAVKHGVGSKPEGGLVELRARLEPIGGVVRIRVSDNGVGIEPERLDSLLEMGKGEVGALSNINERLVGLYRGRASLDISSSLGQGTSVSLSLPVGSS